MLRTVSVQLPGQFGAVLLQFAQHFDVAAGRSAANVLLQLARRFRAQIRHAALHVLEFGFGKAEPALAGPAAQTNWSATSVGAARRRRFGHATGTAASQTVAAKPDTSATIALQSHSQFSRVCTAHTAR